MAVLRTLLGEALRETGEFDRAESVLEEVIRTASAAGDDVLEARAQVIRLRLRLLTDPEVTEEVVSRTRAGDEHDPGTTDPAGRREREERERRAERRRRKEEKSDRAEGRADLGEPFVGEGDSS